MKHGPAALPHHWEKIKQYRHPKLLQFHYNVSLTDVSDNQ